MRFVFQSQLHELTDARKKNGEVFAVFCVRTAFFVAEGRGVSMFNLTMHNGANKFKPYDVGGMAGVG